MAIVAAQSVSNFFGEVVEDAVRTRRVEATDGATHYLVALLADYAHPDRRAGEALERPLTLLLDEALTGPDPADRFERLRTLGDGVLYGCGFFGDHFRSARGRRKVPSRARHPRVRRGQLDAAAGTAPEHGQDLFGELARNFDAFVDVLADVADATIAMGAESSRGLAQGLRALAEDGKRAAGQRADLAGSHADPRHQGRLAVSDSASSGEGMAAAFVRERALAVRVQSGLERVYQLERVVDVGDFVSGAGRGEREALLLRETRGGARGQPASSVISNGDAEPRRALPDHRGGEPLRLRRRAGPRRSVARRQLELELQAEVDKWVVLAASMLLFDADCSARLRARLYERVAYEHRARQRARRALSCRQRRRAPLRPSAGARLREACALPRNARRAAAFLPGGSGREASARSKRLETADRRGGRARGDLYWRPVRVDLLVRDAVNRLDLPFNSLGVDPYGISKAHLRVALTAGRGPVPILFLGPNEGHPVISRFEAGPCSSEITRAASPSTRR